jgi:MoxR-like ATPase
MKPEAQQFPQPQADGGLGLAIGNLTQHVLNPLKQLFVGKDEIVDLMGICLLSRENLFLLGPPGTAKSALVHALASRIDGKVFDYLLTRFTEPNELFGPFDIRKLREGELVTNTDGMLPEADFVFLDELLNANSAILNSLLMALNERVFRRGRETRSLPTLMFVGASNRLPEDESLRALFDRFLLRVTCENVPDSSLDALLQAGWRMETINRHAETKTTVASLAEAQRHLTSIELTPVAATYAETIRRMRRAGIELSDRRVVRLQRPIAASAMLCGRASANVSDLWVLKYIWDIQEQKPILESIVNAAIEQASPAERTSPHPRSSTAELPDAEEILRSLDKLQADFTSASNSAEEDVLAKDDRHDELREQLSVLANRCQWIVDKLQRQQLQEKIDSLWKVFSA